MKLDVPIPLFKADISDEAILREQSHKAQACLEKCSREAQAKLTTLTAINAQQNYLTPIPQVDTCREQFHVDGRQVLKLQGSTTPSSSLLLCRLPSVMYINLNRPRLSMLQPDPKSERFSTMLLIARSRLSRLSTLTFVISSLI